MRDFALFVDIGWRHKVEAFRDRDIVRGERPFVSFANVDAAFHVRPDPDW